MGPSLLFVKAVLVSLQNISLTAAVLSSRRNLTSPTFVVCSVICSAVKDLPTTTPRWIGTGTELTQDLATLTATLVMLVYWIKEVRWKEEVVVSTSVQAELDLVEVKKQ